MHVCPPITQWRAQLAPSAAASRRTLLQQTAEGWLFPRLRQSATFESGTVFLLASAKQGCRERTSSYSDLSSEEDEKIEGKPTDRHDARNEQSDDDDLQEQAPPFHGLQHRHVVARLDGRTQDKEKEKSNG